MAILGLIVCIIVIIWLFFPGGGNDSPTPTPDPPQPDAVAREYWTVEFMFSAAEFENIYLKKVSVNDEGKIARVESFHPTNYTVREEFVYKNGRLKTSSYHLRNVISPYTIGVYGSLDQDLYEMRYVTKGGVPIKGMVYVGGTITRSYDEYEYTEEGRLAAVKRYEANKLDTVYFYNGKSHPESVEKNGMRYVLERDENGNLTRAACGEDLIIEIEYENGYPKRFYKAVFDRREDDGVAATIDMIKSEEITTYLYGERGEILEESIEHVTSLYSGDEQKHIEGYTEKYTYEYDVNGRVVKQKGYLRDKFALAKSFEYDSEGRIISSSYLDEAGNETYKWFEVSGYTDSGFSLKVTSFSEKDHMVWSVENKFDDGMLIKQTMIGEDGMRDYYETYDYYPSGAKKKYTRVSEKYSETWIYAENGNLERMRYDSFEFDKCDEDSEYIKSDVFYGFLRKSGSAETFTLKLTQKNSDSTANFEYRGDLTLKTKTVISFTGKKVVYEYDEEEKLTKTTRYDADGNVTSEDNHTTSKGLLKPNRGKSE